MMVNQKPANNLSYSASSPVTATFPPFSPSISNPPSPTSAHSPSPLSETNGKINEADSYPRFFPTIMLRSITNPPLKVAHNGTTGKGSFLSDVSNLKFLLCVIVWYTCSSLTNNSDKVILNELNYPATLTYFQFLLAVPFSLLFSYIFGFVKLLPLSSKVMKIALPLCFFRILGHVSASVSLALVPVSYAHTVKSLGPLFSVILSRIILGTTFSNLTYISLIPLISGVILATSGDINFNLWGTIAALFSIFILTLQSIYSKKLFVAQAMDEANLLYHSSMLSALIMTPFWLLVEAPAIPWSTISGEMYVYIILNGLTQYGQCIFAFFVVALVSPVTYSIASLCKRIFVIVLAFIWFQNPISPLSGFGICVTFFGLWLYHQSRLSDKEHGSHKNKDFSGEFSTTSLAESNSEILPLHHHHFDHAQLKILSQKS